MPQRALLVSSDAAMSVASEFAAPATAPFGRASGVSRFTGPGQVAIFPAVGSGAARTALSHELQVADALGPPRAAISFRAGGVD